MRRNPTKNIEQYRVQLGAYGSTKDMGANGAFQVPFDGALLRIIASDGSDWKETPGLKGPAWEHVSVSLAVRCPTWKEMDYVKRLFWCDDETVIQYHVPRTEHVNTTDTCLHLWRPVGIEIPRPPKICV